MGETISVLEKRQPIVFFDGVCNLCNGFVQFLIKRDKQGILSFASLQSEAGRLLLEKYPQLRAHDSVILLIDDSPRVKSDAALDILSMLTGWKWISFFKVFPLKLRNSIYDVIARYRYKFFGKRDTCMIPTPELKSRFIS